MIRIYDLPKNKISPLYRVFSGDRELSCAACTVKGKPFAVGNADLGYDYYAYVNEEAAFLSFGLPEGEKAELIVLPQKPFSEVTVRPLSAKIPVRTEGERIFLTVEKPGQFTVEADDHHGALHVFVNPVRDFGVKKGDPNVVYFGAGEHEAGRIRLRSGDTLYLEEGAWVHGSVREEGVSDVKILGYGVLDRTDDYYPGEKGGITAMPRALHFEHCKNVTIDGVVLRDSPLWTVTASACDGVTVHNVKMIGMWNGSSDGFDIVNSKNVTLSGSFLRNGDDCVTIKGFSPYNAQNVERILVKDCVLWCDWGVALQIGAEVCADRYTDIRFENCDIVHLAQAAMSFQSGGYADISNVVFENIRVEYSRHTRRPILYMGDNTVVQAETYGHRRTGSSASEKKEEYEDELFHTIVRPKEELKNMRYEPEDTPFLGWLIHMEICWHWHDILSPDLPQANNHDVIFRNIAVYEDEGLPMPPSKIKGADPSGRTYDVTVENLTVNGKRMTAFKEANFIVGEFTENIVLK